MEKLVYESRPFLYIVGAVYALTRAGHPSLKISGLTLLICGALVLYWRVKHRSAANKNRF